MHQKIIKKIEKLTDKDKYSEIIKLLEKIPIEEKDYKFTYELSRAYQNFVIIGDDDKRHWKGIFR